MRRRFGLALVLTTGLAAFPTALAAQEPPPDADWRTLRTEHFRVNYTVDLEPVARRAAGVAEEAYGVLSRELTAPPRGVIDLVIADFADFSNGLSRPFPSNRILLYARPYSAGEFFARDWIELVTVHELVHAFHVDQAAGVGDLVRSVLGRASIWWPVFPVVATPSWSTEGLATHYESRLTGAGRVRSSIHDMIIRTAALDSALPDLEATGAPFPSWPGGNRAYIYGSRLMRYIADTYGPDAHRSIVDATTHSWWPTFLRFDQVADRAVGEPFDAIYRDWEAATTDSARATAARVRAAGETATRPVAGRGPYAVTPRVAPDGRTLAYTASDWRSDPATRLLDLADGRDRELARRNQFGTIFDAPAWLPDGSGVVVAQLEFQGPYRLYSDLWRVDLDGREHRLTRGARLSQPDVGPDGRIAAVQETAGARRLVVYDPAADSIAVLADAGPGEEYDDPRWSPDGRSVAVTRHVDGRTDLVVVDVATGAVAPVTDDSPLDLAPAWSPDGRRLLWASDRTGILNIMAVAVRDGRPAGPVRQVTNVVRGVSDPEVSPDGATLYLSAYHADGWHIEAMRYDTATWRMAPPPGDRYGPAILPTPGPGEGGGAGEGEARPYSPWPTLRPYWWLPRYEERAGSLGDRPGDNLSRPLRFFGITTGGTDVVGRHGWGVDVLADPGSGRLLGSAFWSYRGLGTPELQASAQRDWLGVGFTRNDSAPVLQREDQLSLDAVFRLPRWRRNTAIRVEGELEHYTLEGRDAGRAELEAAGDTLSGPLTLAGLAVAPGFNTARRHPLSISPEDGISVGVRAGRWWDLDDGTRAYDEGSAAVAGYLGVPVWGFAHHVLAVRAAGFVRTGPRAPARSVGGVADGNLLVAVDAGSSYPIRGFGSGSRWGTRGWTTNAEWRFPIRLVEKGALLGFSLASVSGALFFDAGNAWCDPAGQARYGAGCAPGDPLASVGAELSLDVGIFHSRRGRLAAGVALPIQGPASSTGEPVFYIGTAF